MRIKTCYLPQLHNGENMAFHEESFEQLLLANPVQLGVSEHVETDFGTV
ncbi:MAG: hypothetical protein LBE04_06890 [Prevotellaceae bacterium]|jgi:hypothetical protein|nr:hypothetical protein [Prevotellaceae bacterium]